MFVLLCFLFHVVFLFQGKYKCRGTFCVVATWITVCSLHPGCSPAASQGANAEVPPQQRFHPAWHMWRYSEDWALRKGVPSQAHPQQAQGSSLHTTAACPFPKAQTRWRDMWSSSPLQLLLLQPTKGRFDLCQGSREVSHCRAMIMMLSEPPGLRSLPFDLSLISG